MDAKDSYIGSKSKHRNACWGTGREDVPGITKGSRRTKLQNRWETGHFGLLPQHLMSASAKHRMPAQMGHKKSEQKQLTWLSSSGRAS